MRVSGLCCLKGQLTSLVCAEWQPFSGHILETKKPPGEGPGGRCLKGKQTDRFKRFCAYEGGLAEYAQSSDT